MSNKVPTLSGDDLHAIQEYIQEHVDDFSLREIADRFAMSQVKFQSFFIDEYGSSVYDYLRNLSKSRE